MNRLVVLVELNNPYYVNMYIPFYCSRKPIVAHSIFLQCGLMVGVGIHGNIKLFTDHVSFDQAS